MHLMSKFYIMSNLCSSQFITAQMGKWYPHILGTESMLQQIFTKGTTHAPICPVCMGSYVLLDSDVYSQEIKNGFLYLYTNL